MNLKILDLLMIMISRDIMGIKRQTARVSISVLMMVLEDFSSIHSYVPMVQSSISSTSSVIGGSMLTAHRYIDF